MKLVTSVATTRMILGSIPASPPILSAGEYQSLLKDVRLHSREVEEQTGVRLECEVVDGLDNLLQVVNDMPPETSRVAVIIMSRRLEKEACAVAEHFSGQSRIDGWVFLCDSSHNDGAIVRGRKGLFLAHNRHLRRGMIVKMLAQ